MTGNIDGGLSEKVSELKVVRRDGTLVSLDINKISKVVSDAIGDLDGVSASEVEMKSRLNFYDGITTYDIQETMIKSAADLISVENPNYQYVAARLLIHQIRKVAYGGNTPPEFLPFVKSMIERGFYAEEILESYTEEEIEEIGGFIDHDRDLILTYAAVKQLEGKYLLKNRVTSKIYESPQMINILIPVVLYQSIDKSKRMSYIKRFYDALSLFKISMPTPIMAGVRTKIRQFSSCVLIDVDDSLDSISGANNAIIQYISKKAGIGLNMGRIRAVGSTIRGGEVEHTGCFSFYRMMGSAVKSCSAGGLRGGSATTYFPFWHYESPELMVLRNNRGTEYNRIRSLDYAVQLNGLFYERYLNDETISLFSPSDTRDLYDAFFSDQKLFKELYIKYENDDSVRKRVVSAKDFITEFVIERTGTGRLYFQNVDHSNVYGVFKEDIAPTRMSNLCLEITLPTEPISYEDREKGEIALCTLAGLNLGAIDDLDELEGLSELVVLALDELLDYQEYPMPMVERTARARRSLGIGVINYSYFLAKNGVTHKDGFEANNLTHKTFEAIQYYLLKASNKIAKEKGACAYFNQTKYSDGIMPVDNYKKDVDELHSEELHLDWDTLRSDIVKFGLRNSTLSALMPSETSSQISNATNGIEPPRGLVSIKGSKTSGYFKQLVPDVEILADAYELAFDDENNEKRIHRAAIMQKFVDQSISFNTYYDTRKFEKNEINVGRLIYELLLMYKYGMKTGYYQNTEVDEEDLSSVRVAATSDLEDLLNFDYDDAPEDGCEGGGCTL